MKVTVISMSGGKVSIEASSNDTVLDLKHKLEPFTGLDIKQQALIFNGRTLKNEHTLEQSKITEDTTISMVISLRGG